MIAIEGRRRSSREIYFLSAATHGHDGAAAAAIVERALVCVVANLPRGSKRHAGGRRHFLPPFRPRGRLKTGGSKVDGMHFEDHCRAADFRQHKQAPTNCGTRERRERAAHTHTREGGLVGGTREGGVQRRRPAPHAHQRDKHAARGRVCVSRCIANCSLVFVQGVRATLDTNW
jgi:hypothetical protein